MDVMTEDTPKTKPTGAHVTSALDEPIIHLRDERLTDYTECGLWANEALTNAELMATCPKCINWRASTLEYRAKQLRNIQRSVIPTAALN